MPVRHLAVAAAVCALLSLGTGSLPAAADPKLAPHRAVYKLDLGRADPTGGVVGLRGRLVLEFVDACEGYTLQQRIRTEMSSNEGAGIVSDFSVSSWESRDGKRFRFSMRNEVNGQIVEEFAGNAERDTNDAPGQVSLTKPEVKTIDLPAGTIFPTEHLAMLIDAAAAGRSTVSVRVFDGSGEDGLFETGSHVGRPHGPAKLDGEAAAKLAGLESWPVRIAYFPLLQRAEIPEYEIGFRLFANGISGDLVLDYGDFAMRGTLEQLDILPEPGC